MQLLVLVMLSSSTGKALVSSIAKCIGAVTLRDRQIGRAAIFRVVGCVSPLPLHRVAQNLQVKS